MDGADRPLAALPRELRAEQTPRGLDTPHAHVRERPPEVQRQHRRHARAEGVPAQHQRPALVPARLVVLQTLVPVYAPGRVPGSRRGRLLAEEHLVQHAVPLQVRQDEVGGGDHAGVAVQLRAAQVRHAYGLRVEQHGLVHGVRDAVLHGHRAAHGDHDRFARGVARDEVGLLVDAVGEGDVKQILPPDPRARLQRFAVQALGRVFPVVHNWQTALGVEARRSRGRALRLRGAAAAAALAQPARAAGERQPAPRGWPTCTASSRTPRVPSARSAPPPRACPTAPRGTWARPASTLWGHPRRRGRVSRPSRDVPTPRRPEEAR